MSKYLSVIKITLSEYLVYRLNFLMWRVRNVLRLLTVLFFWQAAFSQSDKSLFGYSLPLMLTYITTTLFMKALITGTRSVDIGSEIIEGKLSNFLLRPINYFKYYFFRDLADKGFNLFFALIEFVIIFKLLALPINFNFDINLIGFSFVFLVLAVLIYFLISLLLSFIAFWSLDVWPPRFLFLMIMDFFAGGFFPLDILPSFLYQTLNLLPFSYILYLPTAVFLGRLNLPQIYFSLATGLFWVIVLTYLTKLTWRKGLKVYTAAGI